MRFVGVLQTTLPSIDAFLVSFLKQWNGVDYVEAILDLVCQTLVHIQWYTECASVRGVSKWLPREHV